MAFASMEDLESVVDLVVFSEALEKYGDVLQEGNIVWVKGGIGNGQMDRDTPSILVDEILSIDEARDRFTSSIHVHLQPDLVESSTLESLKEIFLANKGDCTLFLHLKTDQYREVVVQANPSTKVAPTDELVSQIENIVGEHSVRLGSSVNHSNGA
jgi:DNA polymerase-3 subunit alpha